MTATLTLIQEGPQDDLELESIESDSEDEGHERKDHFYQVDSDSKWYESIWKIACN